MSETCRINYIIATYDGCGRPAPNHRNGKWVREDSDDETEFVLQKHLKTLCQSLQTAVHIKQITILKNHAKEGYQRYYEIDDLVAKIEELGVNVVVLPVESTFCSPYAQYFYVFNRYPSFDFNIVMEDDWVPFPSHERFDQTLLDEYKKVQFEGFLSAWASEFGGHEFHSAISVGIISKKSMAKAAVAFEVYGSTRACCTQREFSALFEQLHDYSDMGRNFMIPFWETEDGAVLEYGLWTRNYGISGSYLLVPIQLMNLGKYKYECAPRGGSGGPSSRVTEWVETCGRLGSIPELADDAQVLANHIQVSNHHPDDHMGMVGSPIRHVAAKGATDDGTTSYTVDRAPTTALPDVR